MKFELNAYHRNIPDEDLLNDLCRAAAINNKDTVTIMEYRKLGTYGSNTIQRRFGSWTTALERAGLKVYSYQMAAAARNPENRYSSNQQIFDDIIRVAKLLSIPTITTGQYKEHGKYDVSTILNRFHSWDKALKLANLSETGFAKDISDPDLLFEIQRLWIKLGRQPTTTDVKKGLSKYSLNTYSWRFGGWREALEMFIKYINADENNSNNSDNEKIPKEERITHYVPQETEKKTVPLHNTNRDPNYRLRFKVMQRDNFKCCICGTSPAKDLSVELHVDHIVPWSKSGETVIDNLQTLCSKCNLGKGDIE
ncbi:homing endonuclease associated repeat-containing protein [Desulfotomaculum copahuensis]|uniref:homing endonuclease associated repeat-containing protein n=1 Tax=Desulfotomaculum copahuensis TaxID=1838280 RepID=UPI000A78853F|nr:HNH endonuclease [Desulfotomaculum copahuensis]